MKVFGDVEFSGLGLRSDRNMFNFGGTQHASSKFHPQPRFYSPPFVPTATVRREENRPCMEGSRLEHSLLVRVDATRKVGWAWPDVPLGLECFQLQVHLRRFTLGVGACLRVGACILLYL